MDRVDGMDSVLTLAAQGGRDRNGEIKIKITSKMIPEGRRQNPKKRRGIANGRLKMAD